MVGEFASGNNYLSALNTWGANGLLARHTRAGVWYYTFDMQGNVAQKLNSAGTVLSSSIFDPAGNQATNDTNPDPYSGFGGQWGYVSDYETGLTLLGHRFYDNSTQRFLTRDPIGYDGGINLYAYVTNNPVNDIDPLGYYKFDEKKFVDCIKKQLQHSHGGELEECWGKLTLASWAIECTLEVGTTPPHTLGHFATCMANKFSDCLQQRGIKQAFGKIAACAQYASGEKNPFPPLPKPIRPIPTNPTKHPGSGKPPRKCSLELRDRNLFHTIARLGNRHHLVATESARSVKSSVAV